MAVKNACDVTIRQSYGGAACQSTFTWVSSQTTPLTIPDLIDLALSIESFVVPALNGVQVMAVQNISLNLQGRGAGVPSYFRPLGGNGLFPAPTTSEMPPEFAYWLRYGVDQTYESISGDEDLFHPIKRGGAYIVGVTDETLTNRIFDIPVGMQAAWDLFYSMFTTDLVAVDQTWTPAVLGEEIITGTGWRYAEINSAVALRVTRLRSRLAVG